MGSDEKPSVQHERQALAESFSTEELAVLKEMAQSRADGDYDLNRRDILAVLTGGVLGGVATGGAVQTVAADASTSDSDGNVGTPTDRVDVFADGVDATSVSAGDELNAPVFATEGDLPNAANVPEGSQAYVQSTNAFYVVEDV